MFGVGVKEKVGIDSLELAVRCVDFRFLVVKVGLLVDFGVN